MSPILHRQNPVPRGDNTKCRYVESERDYRQDHKRTSMEGSVAVIARSIARASSKVLSVLPIVLENATLSKDTPGVLDHFGLFISFRGTKTTTMIPLMLFWHGCRKKVGSYDGNWVHNPRETAFIDLFKHHLMLRCSDTTIGWTTNELLAGQYTLRRYFTTWEYTTQGAIGEGIGYSKLVPQMQRSTALAYRNFKNWDRFSLIASLVDKIVDTHHRVQLHQPPTTPFAVVTLQEIHFTQTPSVAELGASNTAPSPERTLDEFEDGGPVLVLSNQDITSM